MERFVDENIIWAGKNGFSIFKRKRKPFRDLNQVSKKPNLEEDFTAETKKSDRYYVSEYGYTFVDCARQAYYDNYTKMREKRRTIRPLDLLEAATDDAVTKCGGNRDDIYAFLLDSFPSQNMRTSYEVKARRKADEKLAKERKKLFYDTERELEPEEYYYRPPFYFEDLPSTDEEYIRNLNKTYYSNSENSEDSSDSDDEVTTNVKEDLDTTNPDDAEPPYDLDKSSSRNSENSSNSDDKVTYVQDDLFFSPNDYSSEEEFWDTDLRDKNQDEIAPSQNPKRGKFFTSDDDKLEEDIDKELEGLLTQPNPDRVN